MEKFHKNKKGMTMVELLTGLTLTAIIMVLVTGIFFFATNTFNHMVTKAEAKQIVDTVFNYTNEQMTYASQLYISKSSTNPSDMIEEQDKYLCFDSYANKGILASKLDSNVYGTEFYRNGGLKASVSYENKEKKLYTLTISFYDNDGSKLYERKQTVNAINMSQFKTNIAGTSGLSNNTDKLYIHIMKREQLSDEVQMGDEVKQWTVMEKLFNENIAKDPNYYISTAKMGAVYAEDGKRLSNGNPATVANRHGLLGWQYRGTKDGGYLGDGKFEEFFLRLDKTALSSMTVPDKTGTLASMLSVSNSLLPKENSNYLYMAPYHYVANIFKCDLLLYVYGTTYFDNVKSGYQRITNLIYIQEEQHWYYFESANEDGSGGTKGTKGWCTGVYGFSATNTSTTGQTKNGSTKNIYNANNQMIGTTPKTQKEDPNSYFYGIPISVGSNVKFNTVSYAGTKKTYSVNVTSSYQIKQFFKQYGERVTITK